MKNGEKIMNKKTKKPQKKNEEKPPVRFSTLANEDEREKMMTPIVKHLDENGVKLAIVVIIDPKTNEPMPMIRGNLYEAAKLLKFSLMQLKRRINEELGDDN